MQHVVDLHIHSHFSRATSKDCDFDHLYYWGKLKGIHIIGTGDFTHPEWFGEMRSKLEPAEPGLFKLKPEFAAPMDVALPPSVRQNPIRFIPTVEIATIYKKNDAVRKLHQLLVAPSLETVSAINAWLERIGNLKADGRPIFVYDLDGTRAGAMWYLHFRSADSLKDDEARVRASRFGLKETGDADQVRLWTAVQKYLAERNP